MDWRDYFLARQHLAEERVGSAARQTVAHEDQAFAHARAAIGTIDRRSQR